ncbi:MAG: tetratricopeptide repeat protein, partial [Bacteroidota bacterium]
MQSSSLKICFFFFFSSFSLLVAQKLSPEMPSLIKQLEGEKNPAQQLIIYRQLIEQIRYTDPQQALHYAADAFELSKQIEDSGFACYFLERKGIACFLMGDMIQGAAHFENCIQMARQTQDTMLAKAAYSLGILYVGINDFPQSLRQFQEVELIADSLTLSFQKGLNVGMLGHVFSKLEEYEVALPYMHRSLSWLRKNELYNVLAYGLRDIANLYLQTNRLDSARIHIEEALSWAEPYPFILGECLVQKSQIELFEKQYAEAFRSTEEAIRIGKSVQSDKVLMEAQMQMTSIHMQLSQFDQALIMQTSNDDSSASNRSRGRAGRNVTFGGRSRESH